jgi:hypothetical protein
MLKTLKIMARMLRPSNNVPPINNTAPVFFDSDVFLVSYPKSGNTWLRFLLGNYITDGKCDFTNSHLIIPDVDYNPEAIIACATPRIIKSHRPFPQPYKRVVYLVRDGRDVAVSYFHYMKKYGRLDKNLDFQDYLPQFIDGTLDAYGSWGNHVKNWVNSGTENFIVIKYEDIKSNPLPILCRVIEFCGLKVDENKIVAAIETSDVRRMQSLEKKQHNDVSLLSNSDPSMLFVRKGIVGDWKNYFSTLMLDQFMDSFGEVLHDQGYPTVRPG